MSIFGFYMHTHTETQTQTHVCRNTPHAMLVSTPYSSGTENIHILILDYELSSHERGIKVEHGIKCVNQKISRKGSLCITQTHPRVSEGPKWMTKGEHTEEQWGQQRGLQTVSYQRDSKHRMFSTSISFLGSLRPKTGLNILLPTVPMANILCVLSNTER